MVRVAVTETRRSTLVFVKQGVKINQENYQNIDSHFNKTLHLLMEPRKLKSA